MEWKTLEKTEAKRQVQEWQEYSDAEIYSFMNNPSEIISASNLNSDDEDLRNDIYGMYKILVKKENAHRLAYKLDCPLALYIYRKLNEKGMNVRYAGTDEVWYYLNIKVFPDILFDRWGLNDDRFWKNKQRLYLKTLWWYVHLSAHFVNKKYDEITTTNILQGKGMGTDSIAQLVERTSNMGYNISLSRCIMYQYYSIVNRNDSKVRNPSEYFRGIMKLVTSRIYSVDPIFSSINEQSGIEEFTRKLLADTRRGCVVTVKR